MVGFRYMIILILYLHSCLDCFLDLIFFNSVTIFTLDFMVIYYLLQLYADTFLKTFATEFGPGATGQECVNAKYHLSTFTISKYRDKHLGPPVNTFLSQHRQADSLLL